MKCELVAAFLHGPKVIFLDEPTIGLDVVSQKRIRTFLKDLHRHENCTMILTSHYMQDVEELCEKVIIIDQGAKVFEGTLEELGRRRSGGRMLRLQFTEPVSPDDLTKYGRVLAADEASAVLEVATEEVAAIAAGLLTAFPVGDIAIEDVDVEEIIREMFERPAVGGQVADSTQSNGSC
jgi:ABC-2 type transport system ATP-binding protein